MLIHLTFGVALLLGSAAAAKPFKAPRVCRPPPFVNASATRPGERFCLVVGDSVSLGYTAALTANLSTACTVLHAPFSGDGGACDTYYGLQCGAAWFSSTLSNAAAAEYSAIVFNFGLHDTNDDAFDEESRDEYVPLKAYGTNLVKFAALARKYQPKAKLSWLSSTPMHFDMHLNGNVIAYNKVALSTLVTQSQVVDSHKDMYATIVSQCGKPPYYGSKLCNASTTPACTKAKNSCPLISDNEE